MVSHFFAISDDHLASASGDFKYLMCHVISRNRTIER